MIWSHLCRNDSWSIRIFNMQLIRTDGFVQKRKYSWLRGGAKVAILWKPYTGEKESARTAGQESSSDDGASSGIDLCQSDRSGSQLSQRTDLLDIATPWPLSATSSSCRPVPTGNVGWKVDVSIVEIMILLYIFLGRITPQKRIPSRGNLSKAAGNARRKSAEPRAFEDRKRNWFVVLGNAGSVIQPELNQTVSRWNTHTHTHTHTLLSKRDNQQGPTG